MKTLLKLIFLADIIILLWGLYVQESSPKKGALIVGSTVVVLAFVIMPLFLYTRYKDKKLSEYLFPKDDPRKK